MSKSHDNRLFLYFSPKKSYFEVKRSNYIQLFLVLWETQMMSVKKKHLKNAALKSFMVQFQTAIQEKIQFT